MTTRLTQQVLANVHGDLSKCHELHPVNNRLIAQILDTMDELTVDGYDADAAAAALLAFGYVVGSQQVSAPAGASLQDINTFLATMATLAGQMLHAQTHAVAEAPEPEEWRSLPGEGGNVARFDSIPWPLDRRVHMPTAVVGQRITEYHLEALRQYQEARGLRSLIDVFGLTAAQVNEAVTWWNHRAAMLGMQDPR